MGCGWERAVLRKQTGGFRVRLEPSVTRRISASAKSSTGGDCAFLVFDFAVCYLQDIAGRMFKFAPLV